MLIPSFHVNRACRVEEDADATPVGTDADIIVVEKVVARPGVPDWAFAATGHTKYSSWLLIVGDYGSNSLFGY